MTARRGAGRGGNGRFFDYGELRHVVLALLDEQPRHGYDIIRAIDQRTGGGYCPSPGGHLPDPGAARGRRSRSR